MLDHKLIQRIASHTSPPLRSNIVVTAHALSPAFVARPIGDEKRMVASKDIKWGWIVQPESQGAEDFVVDLVLAGSDFGVTGKTKMDNVAKPLVHAFLDRKIYVAGSGTNFSKDVMAPVLVAIGPVTLTLFVSLPLHRTKPASTNEASPLSMLVDASQKERASY